MAEETGAGNLEVQKAINEAISARNVLLTRQNELMKGQLALAIEFQKLTRGDNLEDVIKNVGEINKGLEKVVTTADNSTASLNAAAAAAAKAEQEIRKITPASMGAAKGLKRVASEADKAKEAAESLGEKLGKAFEETGAQMDSMFSMLGSITSSIFGMGSAILSIPLKIFGILTDKAAELMNGSTALREAYENVRETFGDLNKAEAKGVINSFNDLKASGGSLAGTGLSLARIYGHGTDGLAAALNELNETASAMGPVFGVLQGQFEENADKILVMQKGLGLTADDMKALGGVAIASGGDLTQMLQEMGNLALQMGEKFGISSKLLGKDLGYMTQNMGKFGSMTKTQMITSAVYVRKLGLEIKDIEGLMGAFDNFEDAATNAAKLAQGFGMTIDAMKMMKEQDPAKRLDMLRQAFAATGKSIESMSRQERAMLASSAGLDENMVSLALSGKNMGKSYDEIQKEADKSNKKQLSQAEVMDKLSVNIKRMTEAMQNSGSFMTQFLNGIMKGLSQSPEFMKLMRSLGDALVKVYYAGVEVGKMIMKVFPGLSEMFNNLADLFSGEKFTTLLDGVVGSFKTFFEDLQNDPVNAVGKFMKTIKEKFMNFFDKDSKEGKGFLGGMNKFGKAIGGIVAGIGKFLIEGAVDAIKGLIDFIKNPRGLNPDPDGFIENFFSPILQVLSEQGPILLETLKDLFLTLMVKFGPWLAGIGATLFAMNVTKALVMGVITGAAQAGGTALMQKALKKFGTEIVDNAAPDPKAGEGAKQTKSIAESIKEVVDVLKDMNESDIMKAGKNLLIMSVFVGTSIVIFAAATAIAAGVLSGTDFADIAKVFVSVGTALMATMLISKVAKMLDQKTLGQAIKGMLAGALFVAIGMVAYSAAVLAAATVLQSVSWEDIMKVFAAVGLGLVATLALALIGLLLVADGGATLSMATVAMLLAAVFTAVAIVGYALAIAAAVAVLNNVPFDRVTEIFGMVGMALLATFGLLAAAVAGLAVLALSPLAIVGLVSAAAFMVGGILIFAEALGEVENGFPDSVNIDNVQKILDIVNSALSAVSGLVKTGAKFSITGAILDKLGAGISDMAGFLSGAVVNLAPAIQSISEMPVISPEEAKQKMEIFNAIVQAMAAVGKIGTDAAAAAGSASFWGDGNLADAFNGMESFISKTGEAVQGIADNLVKSAVKWSKGDMEKAKTLAEVIGAIAELAAGLTGPLTALAGADTGLFNEGTEERMKNMSSGLTNIISSITDFIVGTPEKPGIMKSMMELVNAGGAKVDKSKIAAVGEIGKVLGSIFSGVGGIVKEFSAVESDIIIGPNADEKVKSMGEGIGSIFTAMADNLPDLIDKIMGVAKKTEGIKELPNTIKGIFDGVKNMISAIKGLESMDYGAQSSIFTKIGTGISSFFTGGGPTVDSVFGKLAEDVKAIDGHLSGISAGTVDRMTQTVSHLQTFSSLQLGSIVSAVTEDIKAVNDALANLGDIDVNATVDHLGEALQLKTEVLNIERKPIQMTVNLNLTMKAEDIAKEILEVSQKATLKSDSKLYHQVRDFLNIS